MSNIFTKPISLPRPRRPELGRPEFRRPEMRRPELRRPELRLPELRRPSGSRPTLGGPTLTMPSLGRKQRQGGPVVGLEIEAGSVAAVEARLEGGVPQVVRAGARSLGPEAFRDGEVAEPEMVAGALRSLFAETGLSHNVRLGIANQRLVVRTLRLPMIEGPEELDAAVRFSAQEQIAMPLDEAVIEHRVVGGVPASGDQPAQIDVMVVAARREMIMSTLQPLHEADLEPVGVDLSAFAMIRALADDVLAPVEGDDYEAPSQPATLFCNFGDTTNLAVARGRSCLFTRLSPAGLDDMACALASATGLSFEHANMWMNHVGLAQPIDEIEGDPAIAHRTREAVEHGAATLADELRLSLDFYGAREGAVPVERIVLCGAGSTLQGLAAEMESTVGLPITVGRPAALADYDAVTAARLTLPLGLALDV